MWTPSVDPSTTATCFPSTLAAFLDFCLNHARRAAHFTFLAPHLAPSCFSLAEVGFCVGFCRFQPPRPSSAPRWPYTLLNSSLICLWLCCITALLLISACGGGLLFISLPSGFRCGVRRLGEPRPSCLVASQIELQLLNLCFKPQREISHGISLSHGSGLVGGDRALVHVFLIELKVSAELSGVIRYLSGHIPGVPSKYSEPELWSARLGCVIVASIE